MVIVAPVGAQRTCMQCALADLPPKRGAASLTYAELEPPDGLRHLVSRFWLLRGRSGNGAPLRLLPDGRIEIVIRRDALHLGTEAHAPDPASESCAIVGQLTQPLELHAGPRLDMVGIRFRTGAARALLPVRLESLTDRVVPLVDVSRRLRLRVIEALSPPAPLSELVAQLAQVTRESQRRPLDELACELIEASRTSTRGVRGVVWSIIPRSSRTLQRRVIASTGVRPGLLRRLLRFRRVLPELRSAPIGSHSRIAQECGYFDHAHLIRDFGAFAGLPPRAFFRSVEGRLCGLPGDELRCSHVVAPARRAIARSLDRARTCVA